MATKGLGLLTFQSAIKGGVRPNLFSIEHGFPQGVSDPSIDGTGKPEESVAYMCKAAALPATNVGTVELPFRGRVLKVLATELMRHGLEHSIWMTHLSYVQHTKNGSN